MPIEKEVLCTSKTLPTESAKATALGYSPLASGLPSGNYEGTVRDVENFASVVYWKNDKGSGQMIFISATIQHEGGKVTECKLSAEGSSARLALNLDQAKGLLKGMSFDFVVSLKGYVTSVTAIAKVIKGVSKSKVIA